MATHSATAKIEKAIRQEDWPEARRWIERELEKSPDNHWLLSRLALSHYEERQYDTALKIAREAVAIVPDCPLALWELAGALDMTGATNEAIAVYLRLLKAGQSVLRTKANHGTVDGCWESEAWAVSLLTDCLYRRGQCYQRLGSVDSATQAFRQYLESRAMGAESIYTPEDALRRLAEMGAKPDLKPIKAILRKASRDLVEA